MTPRWVRSTEWLDGTAPISPARFTMTNSQDVIADRTNGELSHPPRSIAHRFNEFRMLSIHVIETVCVVDFDIQRYGLRVRIAPKENLNVSTTEHARKTVFVAPRSSEP